MIGHRQGHQPATQQNEQGSQTHALISEVFSAQHRLGDLSQIGENQVGNE